MKYEVDISDYLEVDISDYLNINSPIATTFSNFTSWGDVDEYLNPEYYHENYKYQYPTLMSLDNMGVFYPSLRKPESHNKYYEDLHNIFGSKTFFSTLNFHFLSLLYIPLLKFPITKLDVKNIILPLLHSLPDDCSQIWNDSLSLSNLTIEVITLTYPKRNHKLLPFNQYHIVNPDYPILLEKLHTQFLLSKL